MMNAELLEKATAAILGEGYVPPELAGEHAEAVLRVALNECAEIAKSRAIQEHRQERGRPDIAEEIAEEIEALLN